MALPSNVDFVTTYSYIAGIIAFDIPKTFYFIYCLVIIFCFIKDENQAPCQQTADTDVLQKFCL
jgi:hypothetical protein